MKRHLLLAIFIVLLAVAHAQRKYLNIYAGGRLQYSTSTLRVDSVKVEKRDSFSDYFCIYEEGIGHSWATTDYIDSVTLAGKDVEAEYDYVVGTLCGYRNMLDNQGWKAGSFDGPDEERCCGFEYDGFLRFYPNNQDQFFVAYDHHNEVARGVQLIDLKERYVSEILPPVKFNYERLRSIDFITDPFAYSETGEILGRVDDEWLSSATPNQLYWREHMILATDNGAGTSNWQMNSVYIVDRDQNGEFSSNSKVSKLACYQACNGAVVHPNGEIYFTSYTNSEVLRIDMELYWQSLEKNTDWNPYVRLNTTAFKKIFTLPITNGGECQIDLHPSGEYAYILAINRHCIFRTDYDKDAKTFKIPYLVAGEINTSSNIDGLGKEARLYSPYQGDFLKNKKYVMEGKSDLYDFYFCDRGNNTIRCLTPEGLVLTIAGGMKDTHIDLLDYGEEDGEALNYARFHRPTGIVCKEDAEVPTFYILDTLNKKIRVMTLRETTEGQ